VRRLVFIIAILATVALIAAPAALADGDPASDVLVDYYLFNPVDSGISQSSQARLEAVLDASKQAGFPIRVALIASQSDLGTATVLWNENPKFYAQYLGIELEDQAPGQVLVVMPKGFGVYGRTSGPDALKPAENSVRAIAPGPGEQLATAAISAVPLLAAAAGHPIPAAKLTAAERTTSPSTNGPSGSSFNPSVLIALVLGVLLIALAWTLSLRARPLQPSRRVSS
jgi:hypothetical protein